uniref:Uncharacterized protein n=1 Tax=Rhizophora mucronata TaxID=61149 RepID=A0A2P2N4U4_RHIMU
MIKLKLTYTKNLQSYFLNSKLYCCSSSEEYL